MIHKTIVLEKWSEARYFAPAQRRDYVNSYNENMLTKKLLPFTPFLVLAILALLFALWAGLLRLGWSLPAFPALALAHGPLMVAGFLGVLIPLERAVAIRQKWMFAAPLFAALGWITLLIQPFLGILFLTFSSLLAIGILGVMVQREPRSHTLTMALGMLAWGIGNLLWLFGYPLFQVVYWWLTFLVLTIAGERLELSRVLRLTPRQTLLFGISTTALAAGAILATVNLNLAARLTGFSLLTLALWFLHNDLATRNIHAPNPLTRYIAICLFGGFLWLGVGGGLFLLLGAQYAGPFYDATLHTIFVGFVMTMIFGHAPVIFPAILSTPIPYSPAFYFHLGLLHLSLFLRVVGDLSNWHELRKWGGLLNEVAILLFLGLTLISILRNGKK
jgi:hypothetical protein